MNSHSIEYMDPEAILVRNRAWRRYAPEQIKEARRQLELNDVVELPLVDSENRVVCGGAIVQAARELKLASIPVLRVNNMTPEERIQLDIDYAKKNSMWLDIKILLLTIPAIIQKERV